MDGWIVDAGHFTGGGASVQLAINHNIAPHLSRSASAMDSAHLTHTAFCLFLPPFAFFFYSLTLPLIFLYKLFLFLLPTPHEKTAGKVVLITGASSATGLCVCEKRSFASPSSEKRESALQEVAENSRRLGSPEVLIIPTDVSKAEACKKMVEETIARFGHLNYLVTNAGVGLSCLFQEITDITRFTQLMDINFWGMVYPTHYAIPHLQRSKGNIVGIASMAAHMPMPRLNIYSASKAALVKFYEVLSAELGSTVKITMVTPGYVKSEITSGKIMLKDGSIGVNQDARDDHFPIYIYSMQLLIGPIPAGDAKECAEAIVVQFLPEMQRSVQRPLWLGPAREQGDPDSIPLSKRILDKIGADKFYPASIRKSKEKF